MRCLCILFALILAALAQSQDWQNSGQIESIEYKNEIPGPGGRGVAGTEFFHLVYKVSLKTVRTAEVKEDAGGPLKCVQECQGKVHKRHSECTPGSCDTPCTKNHQRQIRGEYKPNIPNMRAARADSGQLARAAGAGLGPDNWSSATSSALRQIKEEAEALHKVTMPHSAQACGVLHGWHQLRKNQIFVKGEFRKVGYYMSQGKKTPIDQPTGSHEKMIAETWIPDEAPSRTEEGWICHCFLPDQPKVPQTPIKDGPTRIPGPSRTPTYSGLGWRKPDGTVVIPDPTQVKVQCVGNGISSAKLIIENNTTEDLICTTEPGTLCDPGDSNTQIVALMAAMDFVIRAGSTTQISLTEGGPAATELNVRAACIEMQKMPPSGKNTMTMRRNNDDTLAALTMKAARALATGPWDQVRVWIYTDKATLAEINERMGMPATITEYVEGLYDVERIGGVAMGPAYRKCFDPTLLGASGTSGNAAAWLVTRLAEIDGPALSQYLDKEGAAMAKRLAERERPDLQQLARLLAAAAATKSEAVRCEALEMMLAVPEAKRADFVRYGGLDALTESLVSSVTKEVELAIGIASAYKVADVKATLAFLSEKGATDQIKQKAAAAMKS